jgi:dTDP-4-amino-4,6-dideoxygalactose transaminase
MRNLDAAVAGTLLDRLDENLRGRRARVERYRIAFAEAPEGTLVSHRPGSACLTQIVRIPPDVAPRVPRQATLDLLRAEGVESSASYRPLHRSFPDVRVPAEGLEKTEREADLLLELPCEPTVPLATIDRIASRLLDAWRKA